MARPRKPNELHKLDGTARSDRGTDVTLSIKGSTADVPVLIDFSEEFDREAVYGVLCDWVVSITGAAKVDGMLLSMLVDQYEIYSISKRDVKERGTMLQGDKGQYVNHSLFNMNKALDNIHKIMREFGMTPSTRTAVKAADQMDVNPLDDIMKGIK